MPDLTHSELEQLYGEADSKSKRIFAEMKSNVLLVSGEHYNRKSSEFWNRIRSMQHIEKEQRIKLTKNHIQRICKIYTDTIISRRPDVKSNPKNDKEIRDQKAAELDNYVWADIKQRNEFDKKRRGFGEDFCQLGECIAKIFWDPNGGEYLGKRPIVDEMGNLLDTEDVYTGQLQIERIYGFDFLVDPEAKNYEDATWVCIRKIVDKKKLINQLGEENEDKKKYVQEASKDTFMVFDSTTVQYTPIKKNQVLVKEYYFKPSSEYPKGYYYITTELGILWQGELPLGIFPIIYKGFDGAPTFPRAWSLIKQIKPYQIEVNRTGSKIAEHQITLGDDKLLIHHGSNIAHGGRVAGVRAITFRGTVPTILSGRSGSQYLDYMNSQINEMYEVVNLREILQEKSSGQYDPYTQIMVSLRHKKRFTYYTDKFDEFLKELYTKCIKLAKGYYPDELLVKAIGQEEIGNIQEFRLQPDLYAKIEVECLSEDADERIGRQLTLDRILQYAGGNLTKEDIGMMIRQMPYINNEEMFEDLTIDYDMAKNTLLALERGEMPVSNPYENHEYMIKKIVGRMKKPSFKYLPQQIQQNFQVKLQHYQQLLAQQTEKLQAAQQGFIPTGGYLVTADFYVPKKDDPSKTQRAKIPFESIAWLIKRLETQGMTQARLEDMNKKVLTDVANMMQQEQAMQQQQMMAANNMATMPQQF